MIQNRQNVLKTFWLSFCMLFSTIAFALDKDVKGKVSDEKGEGLPGVSVAVKGTNKGTTTDVNGNFSISVPNDNSVLVFSSIGYKSKEEKVGGRSTINVQLEVDASSLDEVVVTALGIEKQAKTLTYSAQKLEGSAFTDVRDGNFVNTLSGKAAGIVVTQNAGGPGGATRVTLRGNRSISGNNNALFVVDGVPYDNSNRGQAGNDFGGYNSSDGASNINPDDIENMTILKGAAASALYGSRAANGVILITTKKGKAGKISTDINSGFVMENPMILPKLQNTYGQGNGGVSNTTSSGSWGGTGKTYPNNISDFFRTAYSFNNSVGITGGTEKTQTYFSYTNNINNGIISNNKLIRNTFNLRISNQITKRLSTDAKVTYVAQNIDNKIKVGEESGIVQNLFKIPRSVNLADYKAFEDASGNPTYWTTSSIYMNPYWTLNRVTNNEKRDRVNFLGSATYKILDNLSIMGRASIDRYNDALWYKFYDKTLLFAQAGGTYQEGFGKNQEVNLELLLTGKNKFGQDLTLDYNLGGALNQRMAKYTQTNANGLLVPNQFFLGFGRNMNAGGFLAERELQSVYGTASLNFKDYLIFDVTARNDWSSTLPAPHSYFYPSFGLTTILTDMLKLPETISFAKLRASWTMVGNDADPYRLTQTYSLGQGGTGGFVSRDGTKAIPNLKPELTRSLEIGADLRFLGNRLGLDATWYKTNSINQLLLIDLAAPSGFSNQYINAGNIQNTGIEISLNAKIKQTGKLTYESTLNFARNRNKVIELSEDVKTAFLGGGYGRTGGPVVKEGGSYGDLYGEGWKKDAQGRYVVDANGLPIGSGGGNTLLGNFNPKFTLGWVNSFTYNKFVFSFLLDARVGGIMVSGSDANFAFDGTAAYTEAFRTGGLVLDAVTASGEKNTKAINAEQLWTRVSGGRYSFGEFFTYDATNARLRELTVGYNIGVPSNGIIKNARLSLVGRNLFFIYRGSATLDIPGIGTRKMGFDPDINLGAGNFQGVEYGNLPSTRTIGLNLKLGF